MGALNRFIIIWLTPGRGVDGRLGFGRVGDGRAGDGRVFSIPPPPPAQESICQNPGGNILFCMGLTAALTQ